MNRKMGYLEEFGRGATRESRRRTSGRIRQWTEKMKVVDDDIRAEVAAKRLRDLESDNYLEEEVQLDAGDDDYQEMVLEDEEEIQERPAKRKRLSRKESRRRFERRVFRNFEHVLDFDRVDALPPHIPNYYSINAPPSKLPPRHFCYVCGSPSNYVCPRCGLRFCGLKCDEAHKDSRCLKFIQ